MAGAPVALRLGRFGPSPAGRGRTMAFMARLAGISTRAARRRPARRTTRRASGLVAGVLSVAVATGGVSAVASSAAAAASASTGRSGSPRGGAPGGLDLAKLGSLTDYTAKLVVNGQVEATYRVHSPTDREQLVHGSVPLSVDAGGWEYVRVPKVSGPKVTFVWQRSGRPQLYRLAPYPSYATGFAALTHVTGSKLVRGGPCREAGLAGRLWRFAAAAPGAVYPHVSACVADRSGALLGYDQPPVQDFVVTGVGNVAPIPVP